MGTFLTLKVFIAALHHHVFGIFLCRSFLQMIRIDARPVVAGMKDHVVGPTTMLDEKRNAMSAAKLAHEENVTVTVMVYDPAPNPTAIFGFVSSVKPFQVGFRWAVNFHLFPSFAVRPRALKEQWTADSILRSRHCTSSR
jgi:hypothetical protein